MYATKHVLQIDKNQNEMKIENTTDDRSMKPPNIYFNDRCANKLIRIWRIEPYIILVLFCFCFFRCVLRWNGEKKKEKKNTHTKPNEIKDFKL